MSSKKIKNIGASEKHVISTKLESLDYNKVMKLVDDKKGLSTSTTVRALIRFGLEHVAKAKLEWSDVMIKGVYLNP
jgi:hypothetical protein